MPISNGRGNSLQNIQNYAITDNPVFKVKIRSLATNYEQPVNEPGKKGDQDDPTKKFKMGERVVGTKKDSDKVYTGKIIKIDKGDSTIIITDDETEKEIALDASSCKAVKKATDSDGGKTELMFTAEEYIMTLEEYIYR